MTKTKKKAASFDKKTEGKLMYIADSLYGLMMSLLHREIPKEHSQEITKHKTVPIFKEAETNFKVVSDMVGSQESDVEDKLSDVKTRVIKTPSKNSRSMIARKRDTLK